MERRVVITYKDITDLPILSVDTTPEVLVESLIPAYLEYDSTDDEFFKYSPLPDDSPIEVSLVLSHNKSHDGKYNEYLRVVKYNGVLAGFIYTDGRWGDDHSFIPVGNVESLRDMLTLIYTNRTLNKLEMRSSDVTEEASFLSKILRGKFNEPGES